LGAEEKVHYIVGIFDADSSAREQSMNIIVAKPAKGSTFKDDLGKDRSDGQSYIETELAE
jgi:hypothetical protein